LPFELITRQTGHIQWGPTARGHKKTHLRSNGR